MRRKIAGFAVLLFGGGIAALSMFGGGGDGPGAGFQDFPGAGAGFEVEAIAPIDTFRLLVRDAGNPPVAAVDSGWVLADVAYDFIVSDTDGSGLRYAGIINTSPDTVSTTIFPYGASAGRMFGQDDNVTKFGQNVYIWFDISDLPRNCKIEDAYVTLCTGPPAWFDCTFTTGYVEARADTHTANFQMLQTAGIDGDPSWMSISWNNVDNTPGAEIAWEVSMGNQDDWHDFGPAGAPYAPAAIIPENSAYRLDVSDPIQQIIDTGNQGRGVIVVPHLVGGTVTSFPISFGDHATYQALGNPCLTVTATTRRGVRPWGGVKVPVSLVFDDARDGEDVLFAAMKAAGLTFNAAPYGDAWTTGDDSLWSANEPADYQFIAHSLTHARLGDMARGQTLADELVREWYPTAIDGYVAADTTAITDYAWPAGTGTKVYGFPAIAAMMDHGYRSSRGIIWATTTPIGEITFASWDEFVNIFAVQSYGATAIWTSPTDQAAFTDNFWDYVDLCYTNYGKSAALIYTHGQSNNITETGIGWLIDLLAANPSVIRYMNHEGVIDFLVAHKTAVPPSMVTAANGASATTVTAAAKFDSLLSADGSDALWVDDVWLAPVDWEWPSGTLGGLTVEKDTHIGVAFPGDTTTVDYTYLGEIGAGTARINVKWSDYPSNLAATVQKLHALENRGITPVITLVCDKTDSTMAGSGTSRDGAPSDGTAFDTEAWEAFVQWLAEKLDADTVNDQADINVAINQFHFPNEWTTRNNASGGWRGTYSNLSATVDSTKVALARANASAVLYLGGPSSIYSDIMLLSEGAETLAEGYTACNENGCATADTLTAYEAHVDSIVTVFGSTTADNISLHQYGPIRNVRQREAFFDSLWVANIPVTEAGGPNLNYDAAPTDLEKFDFAMDVNLYSWSQGAPFVCWLKLFDDGTENAGEEDTPLLVGDGQTVTTYRPQWYAYKLLALVMQDFSSVARVEDGVYKITHTGAEETYIILPGHGDGIYTIPASVAFKQALWITDFTSGAYTLVQVPVSGSVIGHTAACMIASEKILIP